MSTIESIGSVGCDYTSLQAWYNAHDGDITGDANAPYIAELEDEQFSNLEMVNSVTDSTHYFHVRAAGDGFQGIVDDLDAYGLYPTHSYPKIGFLWISDSYARAEHIGITGYRHTSSGLFELFGMDCCVALSSGCLIDSCVVQDVSAGGLLCGISATNGAVVRNCALARLTATSTTSSATVWGIGVTSNAEVYCCTINELTATGQTIARAYGVKGDSNDDTTIVRRNLVLTLTATAVATYTGATDTLGAASDRADNVVGTAATEIVGPGPSSMDVHLAATSTVAAGQGTPLSGYANAPTIDFEGDRVWRDIGCDSATFGPVTATWVIPPLWPYVPEPFALKWNVPLGTPRMTLAVQSSLLATWSMPAVESEVDDSPPSFVVHWTLPSVGVGKAPHAVGHVDATWSMPATRASRSAGVAVLAAAWSMPAIAAAQAYRRYSDARGVYRIFNAAEYRFYREQAPADPPEEGDTPYATSASLPATPVDVFADGTWYVSMSYFNGIYDSGFHEVGPKGRTYHTVVIVSGSSSTPPDGPLYWELRNQGGGVVRVHGVYTGGGGFGAVAGVAAESWSIGYTVNASDPPADTPDVTQVFGTTGISVLDYDLPVQAHGAVVRVRLQTRRSDDGNWIYSDDSEVKSITVDATVPTAPEDGAIWPGNLDIEEG